LTSAAYNRYLLVFAAAVMGILIAVFWINYVADPYAMRSGSSARILPMDFAFERELRYNLITAKRPSTLFLGASQVAVGIDVTDPAVPDRRAFNGAPDGGSLREDIRLLRHAAEVGALRRIILGISYNMTAHEDQDAFNDLFLGDFGGLPRHFEAFLSATMLHSSIKVVLDRLIHRPSDMDMSGRLTQAFMESTTRTRATYDAMSRPGLPDVDDFMQKLDELAILACRSHAALTIMLVPDHASDLEMFAQSGQWNVLKRWKQAVVALAARTGCGTTVIDFEDYNFVANEPLPPPGSAREMKFFWDPEHFKAEAGSLMLARVYEGAAAPALQGRNFGTDLNPRNVGPALQRLDEQRVAYERDHKADIARIAYAVRQSGMPAGAPR
jgi:hypothetical protein